MRRTANILMQSVDEAIHLASHECLCDWKGLRSNVHFPSYYKFLQASIFPQRMVTYFTVERLESACYICAAFLRAHRIARQQLHDFIGNLSTLLIDKILLDLILLLKICFLVFYLKFSLNAVCGECYIFYSYSCLQD